MAETRCSDKRYRAKSALEIFPLESSSIEPMYVVRTTGGKCYALSEKLKDVLLLLDGNRTLHEVAETLSQREGTPISEEQTQQIISKYLEPYGLLEETISTSFSSDTTAHRKKKFNFDFILRVPLVSPRIAAPVTKRLTWLFKLPVVITAVASICLTHLAFYQEWFLSRSFLPHAPSEIVILYLLALGTILFHEFGHATACRVYGSEHGTIGFCLYLIFPAFYVDLSNIWRLPGRQRAVIDVGGMYFQLLTTIPLFLLYLLSGSGYFCAAIYAVDSMVLFSLNPIFKFDGYWLLVDLSGLVNLQKRAGTVVKESLRWSFGLAKDVPTLKQIQGKGRKLLLVTYSFISVTVFAGFFLLVFATAPAQCRQLVTSVREFVFSLRSGSAGTLLSLGKLIGNLIVLFFIYRLLAPMGSRLGQRLKEGLEKQPRKRRSGGMTVISQNISRLAAAFANRIRSFVRNSRRERSVPQNVLEKLGCELTPKN